MQGISPQPPGTSRLFGGSVTRPVSLLIFDEVLTFRLAPGGAQEMFGVAPDLTALGKIIGGGLPIGAFGGRSDIMDIFDPRHPEVPFHGGTFNANPMSLAGGLVYLRELTHEAIGRINDAGDHLRDHINALARKHDVPAVATGIGSLLRLHSGIDPPMSARDVLSRDPRVTELLFYLLLAEGVFIGTKRGVMCMSTAMAHDDLRELDNAFSSAFESTGRLIRRGS